MVSVNCLNQLCVNQLFLKIVFESIVCESIVYESVVETEQSHCGPCEADLCLCCNGRRSYA